MRRSRSVIARIGELLDASEEETVGTSMRLPVALRDAALLAVQELGAAASTTALTTAALRNQLEALVMHAALEDHFERHPEDRPSLAELAIAAAELDGHPLAAHPRAIRAAAKEIARRHPDADADAVLLWAEARAAASA